MATVSNPEYSVTLFHVSVSKNVVLYNAAAFCFLETKMCEDVSHRSIFHLGHFICNLVGDRFFYFLFFLHFLPSRQRQYSLCRLVKAAQTYILHRIYHAY